MSDDVERGTSTRRKKDKERDKERDDKERERREKKEKKKEKEERKEKDKEERKEEKEKEKEGRKERKKEKEREKEKEKEGRDSKDSKDSKDSRDGKKEKEKEKEREREPPGSPPSQVRTGSPSSLPPSSTDSNGALMFESPVLRRHATLQSTPIPPSISNSLSLTSVSAFSKYRHSISSFPSRGIGASKRDSIFNMDFRMDDEKVGKHISELEAQLEIEKKIMSGAETICREYSNQRKVDKKTLSTAEATLALSKDKVEVLTDEIARFKGVDPAPSSPTVFLKREASITDDRIKTLPSAHVSHRIQRLMEKIDIEMNVKEGAEKMAKVVGLSGQKGENKALEDLFKSLSNSTAKIGLMMTALQKYRSMTTADGALMTTQFGAHPHQESFSSASSLSIPSIAASEDLIPEHIYHEKESSDDRSFFHEKDGSEDTVGTVLISPNKRQTLTGKLTVKVVAAKNLIKSEIPMVEAFCVLRVDNVVKAKTKGKMKTNKPVWNESFVINLNGAGEIEFEIFDQDSLRGLVFFKFQEIDLESPINVWIEAEPQGKLHFQMSFVKSSAPKRKLSQTGRRGAVRKKKVLTVEGHRLEPKRVYQPMRCAACGEVMLSASCYQCRDCQYFCHRKCEKYITSKCISEVSTSKTPVSPVPHKWENASVTTPSFCAHCGHMLPIGKKKSFKCSECGILAHQRCATLFLPDNCGQQVLPNISPRKLEKMSSKTKSEPNVSLRKGADGKPGKPFHGEEDHPSLNEFSFLKTLGRGNFGKVLLVQEKATKKTYAMKVLKKEFIIENDEIPSIRTEKHTFQVANKDRNPFLINLHSCFQTETRIYFIMDYIPGGDLMLHIQRMPFTEQRSKFYCAEVLLALEYFHQNNIIYRDLKLDNVLLGLDGHIKIADYGLCKALESFNGKTNTFCGTPEFMAPEILKEHMYGRAVDWWAFGIFLYELLLAEAPFQGQDEEEIFEAILQEDLIFPEDMNPLAADLIKKLLVRDPAKRLGSSASDAAEIKAHPFFADIDFDMLSRQEIEPPYKPYIVSELDVGNFDPSFTTEPACVTPIQGSKLQPSDQEEFEGFSYTAPWLRDIVE